MLFFSDYLHSIYMPLILGIPAIGGEEGAGTFKALASTPSGMMSPSLTKLGMASAKAEGTFSSSSC